ncbi:hypothetical protein JW992_10975 [candidate division KSB1 bacterium]|nr:hypothetical protein [candidate division KSB1 bacterium]
MKKRFWTIAGMVLLMVSTLQADSGTLFGLRAGFYTDADEPFIGVEYLTGLAPSIDFNPNIEYVLMDRVTYLTFNLDTHYDFYDRAGGFMYVGGGLGLTYTKFEGASESNTDAGLNLFVGGGLLRRSFIPYVQAKAVLGDYDEFVLGFGIRF